MKQTVAALQVLMKSGWCARRKEMPDAMMVNQNKGRKNVKAPSSVIGEQPPPSEAPMLSSIAVNLKLNSGLETGIKNKSTSDHAAKPLCSKKRIPPSARACAPLKSTSDTDESTTAGSGDLTEDNRFCDSGSDLEVVGDKVETLADAATWMAMPAFIASPPGLVPPPGLEHAGLEAPPGLELQCIQNKLKAAPFAPAISQKIAPPNSEKMSVSNELQSNEDILTSSPGKFAGAMQYLQESMAELQGAFAHYENCKASTDAPELKSAAQANTDTQAARLLSEVSSVLGASCLPSIASKENKGQTLVMPNAARPGIAAPPWRVKASLQQKSDQRSYNLRNSPEQDRQHVNGTTAHTTVDELSADSPDSLRTNLKEVDKLPAERVLIVRKIASLGLESHILLKDHFAKYGVVEKVLVSPTRIKKRQQTRPRPAGMGFILMSSMEEATAILNLGHEQVVNGAVITVHHCEPRDAADATQEDDDQDKMFKHQAAETKGMRFQ